MKKSQLIKAVKEELRGYSPQIGQTKGLTPDTLTKILTKIGKGEEEEVEEGMMFTKEKLMHLLPKGPELEYLLPDLIKTLNSFYANHHIDMKVLEEEKPGLWANIRAKRARGEKPAHKNSNAHKDAVEAGKEINKSEGTAKSAEELKSHIEALSKARAQAASKGQTTLLNSYHKEISKAQKQLKKLAPKQEVLGANVNAMSEGEDWPKEVPSRHGDIIFKLIKVMPDRAKYALLDAETGKEWEPGGRVFGSIASLMASAEDTIMPQGGRRSTNLGEGTESDIETIIKLVKSAKNPKNLPISFGTTSVAIGGTQYDKGELVSMFNGRELGMDSMAIRKVFYNADKDAQAVADKINSSNSGITAKVEFGYGKKPILFLKRA